jgi:HAD superfamily hydrolase (TIGR01459 family)
MGVRPDLYAGLYCSGEETWRAITSNAISALQGRGNKVYAIMARLDRAMVDDAGLVEASAVEADFVLAIGKETTQETVAQFLPDLRVALSRGLPLVCANPDLMVHRGGVEEICAGAIALAYQEMGGEVIWFGKPYPGVYRRILADIRAAADRVLCVGDSLRTDVKGGKGIGAGTLMTVGGIHHADILVDDRIEIARLAELCRKLGTAPDFALPHLCW